jgi:hypothetical protein
LGIICVLQMSLVEAINGHISSNEMISTGSKVAVNARTKTKCIGMWCGRGRFPFQQKIDIILHSFIFNNNNNNNNILYIM